MCIGFCIVSDLDIVLKTGYYEYLLGYDNVDWFMDEDITFENKMDFCFENTNKGIIMSKEDEESYRDNIICKVYEKGIISEKVRNHCHPAGKYRGPAHQSCNINVTQKQSEFIPIIFHNSSTYDCHLFFMKLVGKNKEKVKFDILPKTKKEYISVAYG